MHQAVLRLGAALLEDENGNTSRREEHARAD